MKKRILSIVLALAMISTLAACSGGGGTGGGSGGSGSGSGGAAATDKEIVIDVMWQQEVTETFMDYPIQQLEDKYPNVKVNLVISPQAFSEINNLMAAKDAPDVFFTWFSEVDYYGMMQEDLLYNLDDILAMDTAEGEGTLGDKILNVGLEQGAYEGGHYLLPVTQYNAMNFYNGAFFTENGIEPKLGTMADFTATSKAVDEGTDAVPMIYSGVYSFMVMDAFLFPLINNTDPAAVEAINNEEADAWLAPAVVDSVKAWEELIRAGYISEDSIAMDHIQSQIEFINGRAAMVPVGTWLEGEMADQWPEGFELTPFLAPGPDGAGNSVVPIIEYMVLPKQADETNLEYVAELVQLFYSEENAQKCLEETGALMAYETVGDELMTLLPESVQAGFELTENADKVLPMYKLTNKTQFTESNNLINALTTGDIDAQGFCEKMNELSA